ncbi:MAG: hypothetical protein ABI873_14210, partial [Marmoricola sp.]
IVDLQVEALRRRLADRRLDLDVTPAARDWLARTGYDPVYGARPLRRLVQSAVGDPLARALLAGQIGDGDTVRVDLDLDLDLDTDLDLAVTVVEWGEGLAESLAEDRLEVAITRDTTGDTETRQVSVSAIGTRWFDTGLAAALAGPVVASGRASRLRHRNQPGHRRAARR